MGANRKNLTRLFISSGAETHSCFAETLPRLYTTLRYQLHISASSADYYNKLPLISVPSVQIEGTKIGSVDSVHFEIYLVKFIDVTLKGLRLWSFR